MKRLFSWSAWSLVLMGSMVLSSTGCTTASQHVSSWIHRHKNDRDIRFNLARVREREGQMVKARDDFLKLHESYPKDAEICHRLAILYARSGDIKQSESFFDKATTLDPQNQDIWIDLGYMRMQQQQYAEAEVALEKALEFNPKNNRALINLGLTYGYQGRMDESFAMFRKAGSEAEAHNNLGYLYVQLGKPELATQHYSRALSLDGSMKPAGHALMQLAEMKRQSAPTTPDEAMHRSNVQMAKNEQQGTGSDKGKVEEVSASDIEQLLSTDDSPKSNADELFDVVESPDVRSQERPLDQSLETKEVTPVHRAETPLDVKKKESVQHALDARPARDAGNPFGEVDARSSNSTPLQSSVLVSLCPNANGEVLQLVMSLENSDVVQVKRAIHQLGQLGSSASASIPALREMLRSEDPYVQVHSALALWRIEQNANDVVPVLVRHLGQDDAAVCSFAAAALGEIGSHSDDVLPALHAVLEEQDGYARLHVAEALARSEHWKPHAARVLLDCLQDNDDNVRWLATYALADLAPGDADVVQALTAALGDHEFRVQAGAAFALGQIGPAAGTSVSQLEKLSHRSDDKDVQEAAKEALKAIQKAR